MTTPDYSEQWLKRMKAVIKRHRPQDNISVLMSTSGAETTARIIWNRNEMSWPDFFNEYMQFCNEYGELSF